MSNGSLPVSDPARDYLNAIKLLSQSTNQQVAERIAEAARVTSWTGEFYLSIKLFQDILSSIHQQLLDGENLDPEDEEHLRNDISRTRSLFAARYMIGAWDQAVNVGGPAGPEATTFLRSASRQLRSKGSYAILTESDQQLIAGTLDLIRADMKGVTLDQADFAREALLRGCDEVAFILARVDVFGFSRLEAPVMELGAFLYTVAEEIRRTDGDDAKVKRSLASLSQVYGRLYELSKAVSLIKTGYDGAHWLITHLST